MLTARFCSAGIHAATTAHFVLDLPAGGRGKLKVVAFDPTDIDSSRVLQSSVVTFNGGVEDPFPPAILRTSTDHRSTEFRLDAVGAGLANAHGVTLAATDGTWQMPLSITSRSDTAITASAQLAANVPACVIHAEGEGNGIAAAPVPADPPPPPLDPQSGCQNYFIENIYPPYTIQPKDFAFVSGGWTPAGSWGFHLFYIRQNQFTKLYHGGTGFTEKNLGHAVSNDLDQWTVLDTAAVKVRAGRFDSQHVWAPSIVRRGLTYYMFYTGVDANNDQRIGLATSTDLMNWVQGDSVFQASQAGSWVDPTPAGVGGDAQLRDAFVMEDPAVPGDWLMFFATVALPYTPGMVVGVARSHGNFALWENTFPLWSTLHRWPSATSHIVESPHAFARQGKWWLFYTANGDSVYAVSNPTSPTDTVTANWSQAQPLQLLVPLAEAGAYNFWHATEYLEISALNDIRYFAAWNDAYVAVSYTQMRAAVSPYLFTGDCPSVTGLDESAVAIRTPRLLLTGLRPARAQVGMRIELPARMRVQLAVYDVQGRRVKTLVDRDLPAGATEFSWDGRDGGGVLMGSGVFFARMVTGGSRTAVRVPLIR